MDLNLSEYLPKALFSRGRAAASPAYQGSGCKAMSIKDGFKGCGLGSGNVVSSSRIVLKEGMRFTLPSLAAHVLFIVVVRYVRNVTILL